MALASIITTRPGAALHPSDPLIGPGYRLAFAVVTSLFFMWAIANNFNDILIKQFQGALDLSRMQSGLVQTAFYFGYFTFALPAGWTMARLGYKSGILIGLGLYACGALLFYPAAGARSFGFFLVALYVIAAGLAFLETAANPLIAAMGGGARAAQRLNLAQSFNGLGGFLAPFIGSALIFSGIEHGQAEIAAMTAAQRDSYHIAESLAVRLPYLGLAAVVLCLAALVALTRFPVVVEGNAQTAGTTPLWRNIRLMRAVIAQFCYVGAQVTVWSYFINFTQDLSGAGERLAAWCLGFSQMAFMFGRFAGTGLMAFVPPARMLTIYGLIAALLCAVAVVAHGIVAIVALGLTSVFMSIMFPTIFTLGLTGLGERTKMASSLLVMAIIGGALFPPLTGLISQQSGSIQLAMIVPLACFLVVAEFGQFVFNRYAGETA
jgi:FHS family L-fucose permease-like MFS transporter